MRVSAEVLRRVMKGRRGGVPEPPKAAGSPEVKKGIKVRALKRQVFFVDEKPEICYNASVMDTEGKAMKYNYGFVYKKTKLPQPVLKALLEDEDFVAELDKVMRRTHTVTDEDIYNIAEVQYLVMLHEFNTPNFKSEYKEWYGEEAYKELRLKFTFIKKAVKGLSKALNIDEQRLKVLYEKMFNQPLPLHDNETPRDFPEQNEDLEYLYDVCEIRVNVINRLMHNEILTEALKTQETVTKDAEVYDVVSKVFFKW